MSAPFTKPASGETMGLAQATALVLGSIVGSGIFVVPIAMAGFGSISLVAMALVAACSVNLALLFGWLGRRIPAAGGPYVYPRMAFGEFVGFLNAWAYWISAWAGNAALAVAAVGYLGVFVDLHGDAALSAVVASAIVWGCAAINLLGVRSMASVQVLTTVLKFIPLLVIALVGLFFVKGGNYEPFNAKPGDSAFSAIWLAAPVVLFSFIGLETASVAAARVRNPRRNVGRATLLGTGAAGIVYVLGAIAVFGIVGVSALQHSGAPFADAAEVMFGSAIAGDVMAAAAIVSCVGSLNGWTLVTAELPMAAADEGLFPRVFAHRNARHVPDVGVLVATMLATALIVSNYAGGNDTSSVFTTITLLTALTVLIPYFFSAAAMLYWLWIADTRRRVPGFARQVTVGVVGLVFSFGAMIGAGKDAVFSGFVYLMLGIPVYVWLRRQRYVDAPETREHRAAASVAFAGDDPPTRAT